jgi:hypothetical protein
MTCRQQAITATRMALEIFNPIQITLLDQSLQAQLNKDPTLRGAKESVELGDTGVRGRRCSPSYNPIVVTGVTARIGDEEAGPRAGAYHRLTVSQGAIKSLEQFLGNRDIAIEEQGAAYYLLAMAHSREGSTLKTSGPLPVSSDPRPGHAQGGTSYVPGL